jgi:hypothetical protein
MKYVLYNYYPILYIHQQGDHLVLDTLIKAGINLNHANNAGYTPLMAAASQVNDDDDDVYLGYYNGKMVSNKLPCIHVLRKTHKLVQEDATT